MERLCLLACESKGTVARELYGHFSEHIGGVFRDGLWVGEDSSVPNTRGFRNFIIEKFRAINPPVLRFPGGCFAENYNWRDGIGPRAERPRRMNTWFIRDKRVETNEVGTHEFVDFCHMVGADPYIAANITSMTPLDMQHWMEYCDFPAGTTTLAEERGKNGSVEPLGVKYWGIGNENWGGGGNMTPEQYAREYVRYASICQDANINGAKYIACGANAGDISWTERFMREYKAKGTKLWGLSFHYYCGTAGDPVNFNEAEWDELIGKASRMQWLIDHHRAAMKTFDHYEGIKMVCDEWGCWHKEGSGPSKGYNLFEQQSTMRDAVVTALTLNIFNNNCDVMAMANVAQLCNNLHCLFLAGGENAIVTPTYHVFDMMKAHQGAKQIHVAGASGKLSVSASQKDGKITLTAANLSYGEDKEVELSAFDIPLTGKAVVTTLTGLPQDCNTFEDPEKVKPAVTEIALDGQTLRFTVPAASVVCVEIG